MFVEKQPIKTVTNTDVIIVGAGPTGLSLACQLVRYGIDFVIVDRKPHIPKHSAFKRRQWRFTSNLVLWEQH